MAYLRLFAQSRIRAHIDESIRCLEQAALLTPPHHRDHHGYLYNLGSAYYALYKFTGTKKFLHQASDLKGEAFLSQNRQLAELKNSANLDIKSPLLFDSLDTRGYIEQATRFYDQVVSQTQDDDPLKHVYLSHLGNAHYTQYRRRGVLDDINQAIHYIEQALLLCPHDNPEMFVHLNNLGNAYRLLFERTGIQEHINSALRHLERALSLTPESHPGRPGCLSNFGNAYQRSFQRSGSKSDLENAIRFLEQAVTLAPETSEGAPDYLSNLGDAYILLFQCSGQQEHIDAAVGCYRQASSLTPVAV
ncbi:hypothetical protein FRC12_012781 [Ceratobasidium sp. 428]|nr:hypothetical protein FRC12_012781 [Ceratobasidium sp. 428]